MAAWQFTKGLHDIGNGCWGYILPDGSWGWSNAGLIEDSGETLLVDTLFDLKITAEMLAIMKDAVPAAAQIGTLINTHSNGDHTFGNELVTGARILTTSSVDADMEHVMPDTLVDMLGRWREWEGGDFMHQVFGAFDFRGITITHATETFEGSMGLQVGNKHVRLVDVGPAHTRSDILVHVPEDRVVYTGDILFAGAHPAIWSGPVANWIKACDLMLGWDVDVIVPGHGPIVGKDEVRAFKAYLNYVWDETRKRYEAGMDFLDCAFDIALGEFDDWGDAERMVPNVMTIYGELSGTRPVLPREQLWAQMGRYYKRRRARRADAQGCPGCTDPSHIH
ncbi:MBL fold metallo-hydrolase [Sphingomonas sp.]|uniref:MBL fold metallo-hydrolase n=1 Tax=Sphingomonas sp. TaxID=28214 RepID=UPI001B1DC5C9|nr:MBL fold metallo-hydrolase [Sphingomonas sp.]MBO9711762.1 MBL fold metallo-hydrolase [Sphingomonas sp.]